MSGNERLDLIRDRAISEHSVRMARIAVLHDTRQITDARRDEMAESSWDRVIATAIRYEFQL
jgi:hypothetical protein